MGRGPGGLQPRIISELARQPTKRLPWDELKRRFPQEVEQRTFFRAVRSLRRRGLVYNERGGTRHYLTLTVLGDDELLDLCSATFAMLDAATRAPDVPVPPITGPIPAPRGPACRRSAAGCGHLDYSLRIK